MTISSPAILVVDDEVDICRNLQDILGDLGYRVDIAHDAQAALELVRQRHYDVALLDLMMPGMDGLALYQELKKGRSDTVALLVTAYPGHPRAEEALAAGVRRVLSKPIDLPQVLALIDEAADQPLVLVVDDDPDLCQNLWDLLRDQGYRVCLAHDRRTALARLQESGFGVILLDLRLPDGDGGGLFHEARAANPALRVIVVSGHIEELEPKATELVNAGARAFLPKPFDMPRLLELLHQLTRREEPTT